MQRTMYHLYAGSALESKTVPSLDPRAVQGRTTSAKMDASAQALHSAAASGDEAAVRLALQSAAAHVQDTILEAMPIYDAMLNSTSKTISHRCVNKEFTYQVSSKR